MAIPKKIKKMIPEVKETELQALEAGDTSDIEQSIFSGLPDFNVIMDGYNPGELSEEEVAFINNETEELCSMLTDYEIEQAGDLPKDVWSYILNNKFFGLNISKDHGGHGFSAKAVSAIVTKIASRSLTAAVTVMVPNSLGPGELLHKYGTQEQKDEYLEKLANGELKPCFGLTEPMAGSDATSLQGRGTVYRDSETGEPRIKLDFSKRYITLAPVADLIGLAYHLHDPENILGKGEYPGITVSLIPRDTKDLEIGNRHRPMDMAFQNGTIRGKDVDVPVSSIIGGAENAGEGWKMLLSCLSEGRANSLPSLGSAAGQYNTYTATAYSVVRQQFGLPVGKLEGVAEKLAEMAGLTYATRALKDTALDLVDTGLKPAIPSAMAKYHATEMARVTQQHAMDIMAGKAIIDGPSNYTLGGYRGIPVAITVEGANILTRNLMIFGQGSFRLHPHLQNAFQSVTDDSFGDLSLTGGKMGLSLLASIAKSTYRNYTPSILSHGSVSKEMKHFVPQIKDLSASFNMVANAAMTFKPAAVKKKEMFSAKLGDTLSHLFIASSVLRQFERRGANPAELDLATYAVQDHLSKAYNALYEVTRKGNYILPGFARVPAKAFAKIAGHRFDGPTDDLKLQITESLMSNSDTLKLLTEEVYLKDGMSGPVGDLKVAFEGCLAAQGLERKLGKCDLDRTYPFEDRLKNALEKGILTQEEVDELTRVNDARMKVINVDEVAPENYRHAKKCDSAEGKAPFGYRLKGYDRFTAS